MKKSWEVLASPKEKQMRRMKSDGNIIQFMQRLVDITDEWRVYAGCNADGCTVLELHLDAREAFPSSMGVSIPFTPYMEPLNCVPFGIGAYAGPLSVHADYRSMRLSAEPVYSIYLREDSMFLNEMTGPMRRYSDILKVLEAARETYKRRAEAHAVRESSRAVKPLALSHRIRNWWTALVARSPRRRW